MSGFNTCIFHQVMSVWQMVVQRILILTSHSWGGSTSISSIVSGSPAFLHTAAALAPIVFLNVSKRTQASLLSCMEG